MNSDQIRTVSNPTKMPAEWDHHQAVWLAWPSHEDLWQKNLKQAQVEFISLCRTIADLDPQTKVPRGEQLEVLVPDLKSKEDAEKALAGLSVRFHQIPFGDIWLRDTGPIFLVPSRGVGKSDVQSSSQFARFQFNGWGGKYELPGDDQVAARIGAVTGLDSLNASWVLEGGSIDVDGEGSCLTTRQCLLNPNRNPGLSQTDIEKNLEVLGISRVLWLQDGLLNDHTDGHIDNIARFVSPGVVLCMEAQDENDPNRKVLNQIASDLAAMVDARGRKLEVVRVPSPGVIIGEDNRVIPASYLNFYIGNRTVAVPVYGTRYDAEAVAMIAKYFPGRATVGLSARGILSGGGAFHCISQQQPG